MSSSTLASRCSGGARKNRMGGPHCNKEVLAMLKKLEGENKPSQSSMEGVREFQRPGSTINIKLYANKFEVC